MIASDCVSISELKKSPAQIIKSLKQDKKKFIFVNNKPEAMIIDFQTCEELGLTDDRVEFGIMDKADLSPEALAHFEESEKIPLSEYINFQQ
jgi:hypothetical protein